MLLLLFCLILATLFACILSRSSDAVLRGFFGALAVFLPASEIGKQLLLYVTNGYQYQWWYFPFQLCSMPLYLLPIWYLHRKDDSRLSRTLAVFLTDFSILGGIAVFADQSGMQYALPVLTVHSYLWHFLMILLGLTLFLSGKSETCPKAFLSPGILFLFLAFLATLWNVLFHTQGSINMFYVSPYENMNQIVFRSLTPFIGQTPAKLLYLLSILAGAFLVHMLLYIISNLFPGMISKHLN